MNFVALIALFVFNEVAATADDDEESCLELFKSLAKPRECCDFPQRHILSKHQEKCKQTCDKIGDETGGCCAIDCNYHATGVFDGKEFNEKALLELYENDLNERRAGKFDQWLPIVEKSIEKCQKIVPKSSEIFVCNVPQFVLDTMDCVDHQNFVNCPKFDDSTSCQKLKEFVEKPGKCGKKVNGNFIVDYRIFEVEESKKMKEKAA